MAENFEAFLSGVQTEIDEERQAPADTFARRADTFARQASSGAAGTFADVLGALLDPALELGAQAGQLVRGEEPRGVTIGGGGAIEPRTRQAFEAAGFIGADPTTEAGRIGQRTGQGLAEAAVALVPAARLASGRGAAARALAIGTGTPSLIGRAAIAPLTGPRPLAAAGGELVAGAAGGTAVGAAREVAELGPVAELGIEAAGNVLPGLGRAAVVGTGRAARALAGAVGGRRVARAEREAAETLSKVAPEAFARARGRDPVDEGAIIRMEAVQDLAVDLGQIEGLTPTAVAVSAREPAFVTAMQDFSRSDVAFNTQLGTIRARNTNALYDAFQETAPELPAGAGGQAVGDSVRAASGRKADEIDTAIRDVDTLVQSARGDADARIATLTGGAPDPEALLRAQGSANAVARSEFGNAATKFKNEMAAKFDSVERVASVLGLPVRMEPLQAAAQRMVIEAGQARSSLLPNAELAILESLGDATTFAEVRGFQQLVTERAQQALISGDGTQARWLLQLKDAVESTFDLYEISVMRGGEAGAEIAQLLRETRAFAAEGFRVFKDGPTGLVSGLNPSKSPVPESATLGKFYRAGRGGGQIESARDFHATLARMEDDGLIEGALAARNAMNDHIISDAVLATTKDGRVSRSLMESYIRSHNEALSAFPDALRALRDMSSLTGFADEVAKAGRLSTAALEKGRARLFSGDIEQRLKRVFAAEGDVQAEAMEALLREVDGDPMAVKGLQRHFWDETKRRTFDLVDEPGTNRQIATLNGQSLGTFTEMHAPAIERLYGEKGLSRWRTIAAAARATLTDVVTPITRDRIGDFDPGDFGRIRRSAIATAWRMQRVRGGAGAGHMASVGDLMRVGLVWDFVAELMRKLPSTDARDIIEHAMLDQDFFNTAVRAIPDAGNAQALAVHQRKLLGSLVVFEQERTEPEGSTP